MNENPEAKHIAAGGLISDDCRDTLRRAAGLLSTGGWTACAVRRGEAVCVLEALRLACDGKKDGPYRMAVAALVRRLGWKTVIEWQDAPGRTAEDVLALLEAVASEASN